MSFFEILFYLNLFFVSIPLNRNICFFGKRHMQALLALTPAVNQEYRCYQQDTVVDVHLCGPASTRNTPPAAPPRCGHSVRTPTGGPQTVSRSAVPPSRCYRSTPIGRSSRRCCFPAPRCGFPARSGSLSVLPV